SFPNVSGSCKAPIDELRRFQLLRHGPAVLGPWQRLALAAPALTARSRRALLQATHPAADVAVDRKTLEHHDRSRISRTGRARVQPHTAGPRVVRGSRYAAVALSEARQPALHVPPRVGRRGRALRALFVH